MEENQPKPVTSKTKEQLLASKWEELSSEEQELRFMLKGNPDMPLKDAIEFLIESQ